jgi:hypothetical protein
MDSDTRIHWVADPDPALFLSGFQDAYKNKLKKIKVALLADGRIRIRTNFGFGSDSRRVKKPTDSSEPDPEPGPNCAKNCSVSNMLESSVNKNKSAAVHYMYGKSNESIS